MLNTGRAYTYCNHILVLATQTDVNRTVHLPVVIKTHKVYVFIDPYTSSNARYDSFFIDFYTINKQKTKIENGRQDVRSRSKVRRYVVITSGF